MISKLSALAFAVALLLAACTSGGGESTATTTEATTTAPPAESVPETVTQEPGPPAAGVALPASLVTFGEYTPVPLLGEDAPAFAGPATPRSLEGVQVAPEVERALGQAGVTEALLESGFVVVPADFRLSHFAYQGNVYEGWPVFVTTDTAYHTWHLVFDKVLRSLEQEVLLPKLETLVSGLLGAAQVQAAQAAGTPLEDPASRVDQLYQVAAAELGLPATLGPLAEQEQALIDAHSAQQVSPILGTTIDYSLFAPRGHYTRNDDLARYFRAMSVLGQLPFCLPETLDCPGLEPARLGILASRPLAQSPDLEALWSQIYEPTAFLVGTADDYTPLEVAEAVKAVSPTGLDDPSAFADDAAVQAVLDQLAETRPVSINPDRASIRVMGTRFVLDSFIFDQLLYPNVGTEEKPRLLPSALDLAASFGSDFAHEVLEETGETDYQGYEEHLAALKTAVADRPPEDWGSTVYDAWLYALQPVWVPHGKAYPDFMRTQAWAAKGQQAGLGSYAELKHDTILYAKQAVAEGGDNAPIPPRRNWVEPEPVAFGRLASVVDLMHQGLGQRELLTEEQDGLLTDVSALLRFLGRIAADELAGVPISEKENDRLTYTGDELEGLYWRTADPPPPGEYASEADQDVAVIADIASSAAGVLEVGTGRIDRIYVLVPNDQGTFQVALGGVYSYYEFANPPGERLTDEAWRELLDSGEAPDRPAWQDVFLPQ